MPRSGPQATREAAAKVATTGAGFLDAPFTGSKMAAQNGKLVYYIGGDSALLTLAGAGAESQQRQGHARGQSR